MSEHRKLTEYLEELHNLKLMESSYEIDEKDILFNEIVLNSLIYNNEWFSLEKSADILPGERKIKDLFRYFNAAAGLKYKFFVLAVFFNAYWLYKICLNLFSAKKSSKNQGHRFMCPCCNNRIAGFLDFDYEDIKYNPVIYTGFYKKTICPVCQSLPRHRILAFFIEKHPEMFHNKKILVTGMSPQEYILFKRLNIKVENSDVYDGANFKWDIQNIPCTAEQYDVIICNHVLEHVKDYKKALKELYRILKQGGVMLMTVPVLYEYSDTVENLYADSNLKRKLYYGQNDHLRIFGRNFSDYLTAAGFSVETADGKKMPRFIRPVVGPASYDDKIIYLCKKSSG